MDYLSTLVKFSGQLHRHRKHHSGADPVPREMGSPGERLRRCVRLVIVCVRLCQQSQKRVESHGSEFLSVLQYMNTLDVDRGGLYFDPSDYRKTNKEERLPVEARRILQRPQDLRTDREIHYLQIVLRKIKAFAEYPNEMQIKLCQVGWFEAYNPRRAIVRQDQLPQSFYFIICGTVLVTAHNKGEHRTRLLVSLHRGMSFGELAVITKKRRQATVSTQTFTELLCISATVSSARTWTEHLCISATDFETIFMAGGIKSVTDPRHNAFLSKVRCLRDWPIESLSENPQACMFHYFNRGEILVRDSNRSDWIYIVKSGSLSVVKKLKKVEPEKSRPRTFHSTKGKQLEDDHDESKSFGTWSYRLHNRHKRPLTERVPETYKTNYELERRLDQTLPGYYNTRDRLGVIDYDDVISNYRARLVKNQEPENSTEDRQVTEEPNQSEENVLKLPHVQKTTKGAYLSSNFNKRNKEKKTSLSQEIARKERELQHKLSTQVEGRKTIVNEYDNRPPSRVVLTEADLHPVFIVVQVLEKGQYFGIANMIYQDQPSMSLVSNGAECIMISKKFFMEKKTDATMRSIYQSESPFPNDETLQRQLQSYVNWQSHRKRVYDRIVGRLKDKQIKRKQFSPQVQGQYCFRTGPT
ncbi:uncharacterized protein LOC125670440 isoform X2 [Ostrea edulis]|uniref:uncharacterized protein LOC125670440 isoform X2 n=1 Tax=Ostrea edulis TaxID=37623 RepID=UPI0024AEE021|nr:uncharacterized protein LOC125670440 isoform X2 [Ostrea edulis]